VTRSPLLGVVLSAGASTRMGSPKALLKLPDGRHLVQAHVAALAGVCDQVVVVGGAHTQALAAALGPSTRLLDNVHWRHNHAVDSLALALRETRVSQALVTPVDVPPAGAMDLAALVAAPSPAVLAWRDQPGHPVRLGPALCERVRQGPVPGGLRTLLEDATRVPASGPEVLLNLNTPASWAAWAAGD